jgi:acyl-CoA thioester hydrolase
MSPLPEHEHALRVRYAETDQMGVVYHAHYLVYMEEGRTRLMESLGHPYHELERAGWALVVRKAELRYRSSARYGDELRVRTRVLGVGGASIRFGYEIRRAEDGMVCATGSTELACVDLASPERRPALLPEPIRAALEDGAGQEA